MKSTILLLLFVASTAWAARQPLPSTFELMCITDPMTTSYIAKVEGDKVVVQMFNANGVKYMPIHEGLVTSSDFDFLKNKSGLLTQLSDNESFSFSLSDCFYYSGKMMSCSNGSTKTINGKEFQGLHFFTSTGTSNSFGYTFTKTRVVLSIYVKGEVVMDIPMHYADEDCVISGLSKQGAI